MAWSMLNQTAALMGQVRNVLIEFQLSETNGSCQAQTWTDHLTETYEQKVKVNMIKA